MAVILGGLLWPLACAPSGRLRRPVRRTASRNATGGLRQVLLWRSGDGEGGQRRLQRWRVANDGQVQLVAGAGEMSEASALVDAILAEVDGTDGGVNISIKSKEKVDAMLEKLEEIGAKQLPRPLDNDLIWGNYEVSYVSSGSSQRGQPAGGRFRGSIGRAIFQTRGVYQSVLQPDLVTNKVEFALLGIIRGAVALRGRLKATGSDGDTVKVVFAPPCLNFGGLHFSFGPESDVVLKTTYLDERVRMGKGSRGSLFVFTRGGAADAAGMDAVGTQRSSTAALLTVALAAVGMCAGCYSLWQTGALLGRAGAVLLGALLVGMSAVLLKGGVED